MVLYSVERFYRPLNLSFFDTMQCELTDKFIWCYQWLYFTFNSKYALVCTFLFVPDCARYACLAIRQCYAFFRSEFDCVPMHWLVSSCTVPPWKYTIIYTIQYVSICFVDYVRYVAVAHSIGPLLHLWLGGLLWHLVFLVSYCRISWNRFLWKWTF